MLSISFCAVPALHPRQTRDELPARPQSIFRFGGDGRPGIAGDRSGGQPVRPLPCAVRRPPGSFPMPRRRSGCRRRRPIRGCMSRQAPSVSSSGVFHGRCEGAVLSALSPDDRRKGTPVGRRRLRRRSRPNGPTCPHRCRTFVRRAASARRSARRVVPSWEWSRPRHQPAVFMIDARQQVVHRHPLQIVVGRSLFRYSDLFHI